MNFKNRFITVLLCTMFFSAHSQSSTSQGVEDNSEMVYLIHIDESNDSKKFFPKLYPIGFIIKKEDETHTKTNYYLGDFANNEEARKALKTVHSLGYREAFIVQSKH